MRIHSGSATLLTSTRCLRKGYKDTTLYTPWVLNISYTVYNRAICIYRVGRRGLVPGCGFGGWYNTYFQTFHDNTNWLKKFSDIGKIFLVFCMWKNVKKFTLKLCKCWKIRIITNKEGGGWIGGSLTQRRETLRGPRASRAASQRSGGSGPRPRTVRRGCDAPASAPRSTSWSAGWRGCVLQCPGSRASAP